MGVFARLFKRETTSGKQVDTSCDDDRTLEEQLVDCEAWLAKVQLLPDSYWRPRFVNGQLITHTVDAKNDSIAYAKADVAELRAKLKCNGMLATDIKPSKGTSDASGVGRVKNE